MKATIFDIERGSFVDGPGIRTTVFFKGCNLRCAWCHNPESQSPHLQMMFHASKCTHCGKCREKCPNGLQKCDFCGKCTLVCPQDARQLCGREYTVDEVMRAVERDKAFYENSGGGVTFSGGECMLQIDFLEQVLKRCKQSGIHTAVDTAGHVPFAYFERIMPDTDLFLYDVKCLDDAKHMQYTGVSNERILENLRRLLTAGAAVWVRIPVIAGVNDSVEEMEGIRRFLDACGAPERVELLPYHGMGEHKYAAIGKQAPSFGAPSTESMERLRRVFA